MTRRTVDLPLSWWRLAWLPLLVACGNTKEPGYGTYTPDTGRTDHDDSQVTDDTGQTHSDDTTDTNDSQHTGGGDSDSAAFDEPGDLVENPDGGSEDLLFDLTDASGDSNKGQEFYLVVANSAESSQGFRVKYQPSSGASPTPPPAPSARNLRHSPRAPLISSRHQGGNVPVVIPPPPISSTDVGSLKDEFLVRDSLTDDQSYSSVLATLWAVGTNVSIWVDDDVPIDWDYECDGIIDVPSKFDAFGFDNCDLNITAQVLDTNIIPNARTLFGEESDIDGDGRVSVLITPVLNGITLTSDDEDDFDQVLSSYAEPAVDLTDFNERTNPGSDEKEVIYVFAPDPYGFYNPNALVTIDSYNSYEVAAEVARSFTYLISYNQHVLINGGAAEDDWLNDAMGTLAADLCGFGASYYEDVWSYLDAPHLYPLVTDSTGSLEALERGSQYLFARWLYDYAEAQGEGNGATVFHAIMQSAETGTDAVLDGVGETNFGELVLKWQIALLTTGLTDGSGAPLVDVTLYPPYAPAEIISAPTSNPGTHYGANGYQVGINIRGLNTPGADGHTDAPTSLVEHEVRLDGPDDYIYTPGFAFYGWMDKNYASQFIKLTGINYDRAEALVQANDPGVLAAVIRWNDPVTPDYTIESVYSPTDVNRIALPALPMDGSIIRGVGELSPSGSTDSVSSEGKTSETVDDTDQWVLDLSDRPPGQEVHVIVWLDRHFADTDGNSCPSDPWIAVAPVEDLPAPTVYDTVDSACTAGGNSLAFGFPTSLLSYLYAQDILSSTMYPAKDMIEVCGVPATGATDCTNDWDQDGVLDEDEPLPTSFYEQVLVQECKNNGGTLPTTTYSASWLDVDELDEDSDVTSNIADGAGGKSGATGEEGYVEAILQGGRQYAVVVGSGSGDTGPYEISLREVL